MIDLAVAQQILGPYHDDLARMIYEAWAVWKEKLSKEFANPHKRTIRTNVFNLIVERAKTVFGAREHEGIRVLEEHESILVCFGDEVAVRFKKLDEDLRPSNYPTPRQMELGMQMPLAGVPDCNRITVGYVPDTLEESIQVFVALSNGKQRVWEYSLAEPATELIPFHAAPNATDATEDQWEIVAKPRVKQAKKRMEKAEG
jgi:hypothetical protein